MKRFFYTTAAVVAFAFSGMANTIELNMQNFELKEDYLSFEITLVDSDPAFPTLNSCIQEMVDVFTELLNLGFTRSESYENAAAYYENCISRITNPFRPAHLAP